MKKKSLKIYFYQLDLNEIFYSIHIISGLEQLGHQVLWNQKKPLTDPAFKKEMKKIRPDLIVFYGFSFLNFITSNQCECCLGALGIPYVTIFTDNPLRYLCFLKYFNTSNHITMVADKILVEMMIQEGYQNVFHLPLFFNPKAQYPRKTDPKLEVDVAYAATVLNFDTIAASRRFWPFSMQDAADKVYAIREQNPGQYVNYFKSFKDLLPIGSIKTVDAYAFMMLANQNVMEQRFQMRMEIVHLFKSQNLHIFGKSNWKSPYPSIVQHPHLDQNTELPKLYSSAKINLSTELHPSCVHQRIYEIHGAKGFVISEYKSEIEDQFELGKETICFRSLPELLELVQFYLTHDSERLKIAQKGHDRALACHAVKHRMAQMLALI